MSHSIIARMAVVFITKGVVEGDARSDGDVDSADSEDSVLATQDDKDTVSNALYRRMSESNTSLGNRRSFIGMAKHAFLCALAQGYVRLLPALVRRVLLPYY